jgi:hypothetical protein
MFVYRIDIFVETYHTELAKKRLSFSMVEANKDTLNGEVDLQLV